LNPNIHLFIMEFYALTGLINGIVGSVLGLFVYFKNRKALANKLFGLFCLAVSVWSYSYFLWQISTIAESALFWSRGLMAGAIFISIFYFHFIISFLKRVKEHKKTLVFGYFIFTIFFFLNFTPFFVKNVTPKLNFSFWPNPGILYHPFLLLWLSYMAYSIYLLLKELSTATGVLKTQVKYILIGTIIGYSGGITNYLLWYDIRIPPFGNWTTTLYLIIVAYTFLKYHLLGIRVIITEISVGAIGLIVLIQAVTAETLGLKILGFTLLFLFGIVGYFLIESVLKEITLRTELEKAYAELEKLDKAKSEFISIASHQLRTPLTAIKGYISLIREKTYGVAPGKMKRPLKNIYISTERLIKLVNDLLNISRIEAGKIELKLEKLSLEEVISTVAEELKPIAQEKSIYLKWEKNKKTLSEISLDREKIRQVILNIVDNGIRYTYAGGVMIKCQKTDGKYLVSITDTGEGLTKNEIYSLFKTFTRGSAGQRLWTEGVGLGLYIAKKFLELHNGKIWVESPGKGQGSTFYIELPIK